MIFMNKSDLIKYGAIVIVLIFIFELFAMGFIGRSTSNTPVQTGPVVSTGSAQFDVVLKYYEPYLAVVELNESKLDAVKTLPNVEGVTASGKGFIVSLKSSSDVIPTAKSLAGLGLNSVAVANIQFPNTLDLYLPNGTTETITTSGGLAQMELEPDFAVGESFTVRSQQINAQNGILYNYVLPTLASIRSVINVTGKTDSVLYDELQFSIPWEKRNVIDLAALKSEFGSENVSYDLVNSITLPSPLTNAQMIEKKKLDYIDYISESSITPVMNFTNQTMLYADFGNLTLPSSSLVLIVPHNSSFVLPYSKKVSIYYNIILSSDNYTFSDSSLEASLENVSVGDTVTLESAVTLVGKKIKSVDAARRV
jgi:hypothetical protein